MWKPWEWARSSNERAVGNARLASAVLSRGRVERADIELFLDEHAAARVARGTIAPWTA